MVEAPEQKHQATQHRTRSRGNGEGSVYWFAKRQKWVGALTLEGGKRKVVYADTRQEAAKLLVKVQRDVQRGLRVTHTRYSVGSWMDYWLENVIRPEREPTTHELYEMLIRRHIKPGLGKMQLAKLQAEDVERWLRDMERRGVGLRTRQTCLARLRTALNLAMRRGHVARNVASPEFVDAPTGARRKHQAPKLGELQRLLDVTRGDRLHAMLLVALGLGLRRGEVLGLQWEDIDLEARTLSVRRHVTRTRQAGRSVRSGAKTEAGERTIMLPQTIVHALRRHQSRQFQDRLLAGSRWKGPDYPDGRATGFVFTSTVGTVMEPRRVNAYLSQACRRAGLSERTFHGLRHDFGSLLLAAGVPTRVVQEMLGHANPYVTMGRYQHVPDELQREAADRLDGLLGLAAERAV